MWEGGSLLSSPSAGDKDKGWVIGMGGGVCTLLDMALLLKLSLCFRLIGCLDVSPTLVVTSPFNKIGVYPYLCLSCKKYSTVRCTVFVAIP